MIHVLDSFTLILLNSALFTSVRNIFSSCLFFFLLPQHGLFLNSFILPLLHLFPLTVHVFISCLTISSLITCISMLNSYFSEMMALLSLGSYVSNFYLFCSNIFFCQMSFIFSLYFPILFFLLNI